MNTRGIRRETSEIRVVRGTMMEAGVRVRWREEEGDEGARLSQRREG